MTLLPHPDSLSPAQADHLLEGTARAFGLAVADLTGADRRQIMVRARAAAVWLLRSRQRPGKVERSFPVIGQLLGGRDHSTVINLFHKAEYLGRGGNEQDAEWAARVAALAMAQFPERAPVKLPEAIAKAPPRLDQIERATCLALAESCTRYGEGVIDDDSSARMRARGSVGLAAAIEAYRAGQAAAA